MLYIEHLTKTFGEKKAVDDLSLHIAPGEIYGFIGHNGAGKTTTLKSVVGIQQFDSGRITIGGHSIQDDPIACKKMLAYIPDNPDLYEFMTGIQYLNFIADIFGVEESARQAAASTSSCTRAIPPRSSIPPPSSRAATPTNTASRRCSTGWSAG